MTLDVIRDPVRLMSIEPEWTALVSQSPIATPFQLPVWQLTWWKHFGSRCLRVFVFRKEQHLVGVIPCFLHEWNGRRQLTLIGSGISDYLDPVITPTYTPDVIACLQRHLDQSEEWDVCDWQDLSPDTEFGKLRSGRLTSEICCSAVDLRGSFEDFVAGLSKDLRRNIRRYSERAKETGSLEFEVSQDYSPRYLDELVRLHAIRWEAQGEPGMVVTNHSDAFLRDVVAKLASMDIARFFTISLQGRIAAILLGFAYDWRIFAYMTAFDPELHSLGVGRTLLYEAMRYAQKQGYVSWDFLRGEEAFKLSWGARLQRRCRLILERK